MSFVIKAEVRSPRARTFAFAAQKTMYGGKYIAEGDTVFIFASENEGGRGLIARGVVSSAEAIEKKSGIARQTPRMSVAINRTALAKRPLGWIELKRFSDWKDRAQFQILSPGDEQDRRNIRCDGSVSRPVLLEHAPHGQSAPAVVTDRYGVAAKSLPGHEATVGGLVPIEGR
jgi:hypothetical protein